MGVISIPSSWSRKKLFEFAEVKGGNGFPLRYQSRDSQISFLKVSDLGKIGDSKYLDSSNYSISNENLAILKARVFQKDTIIFAKIGAAVFLERKRILKIDACIDNNLAGIILTNNDVDVEFLHYLLENYRISNHMTATALPSINTQDLLKAEFNLPLLDEQKEIAGVLRDIDALVLRISELILKKKDIKQGLIQELFNFNNVSTERLNLRAFGEVIRGVSYKPEFDLLSNDSETSFRLLRSNNIFLSRINFDNTYIVSGNCVSQNQILLSGDILICMANGSKQLVGKSALFLSDQLHNYTFGAFMGAYRPVRPNEGLYISYLFQTERYRNLIELALAGSSINNLTPKAIMEMEFDFPGEQERSRISEILNAVDLELKSLEAEMYKYECIKQGMKHDLLTGKVRLV